MDKRTKEFVLGLIGGVLGICSGFLALFFGGLISAFGDMEGLMIGNLGVSAILFSIMAIVGASMASKNGKLSGLILLLAGIGGTISVSLFYLIPLILIIIPAILGLIKPSNCGKQFKWLIWVPVLVLISTLIFAVSLTQKPDPTTKESTDKPAVQMYNMGQGVPIGDLVMKIHEAVTIDKVSNGLYDRVAKGQFLIISIEVLNSGKEATTLSSSMFTVVDSQGNKYEEDTGASMDVNNQSMIFLDTLNPNLKLAGFVVFDIPKQASSYVLHVNPELLSSDYVSIELQNLKPYENKAVETQAQTEANKAVASVPVASVPVASPETATSMPIHFLGIWESQESPGYIIEVSDKGSMPTYFNGEVDMEFFYSVEAINNVDNTVTLAIQSTIDASGHFSEYFQTWGLELLVDDDLLSLMIFEGESVVNQEFFTRVK